jgi:hypothetical protein
MLTLYEVKQNRCFRCAYKQPSYIRNAFLMLILLVILVIFFIVFMANGDSSYPSMMKVLRGFNSHTFNYLENHASTLYADKEIPVIMKEGDVGEPSSLRFFSDCVRLNRPCELKGLASKWPAIEKWSDRNGGKEYLTKKFGN